jgi:3',5'-cyclic AMP phosphodiesterase CpdA
LGDHHLRGPRELPVLDRQLAHAVHEARADHLILSGDLLDRWDPRLLREAHAVLASYNLLDPARLTLIHGNHDLASSGGWPRRRADILRMAIRFWDPPPLLARRRARFTRLFDPVAAPLPFARRIAGGSWRVIAIDSTPLPWLPFTVAPRAVKLRTALGRVTDVDLRWLASLPAEPSILVMHHYPLATPPLLWNDGRVIVPMHVTGPVDEFLQAARRAGVRLIACGHVHRSWTERRDGVAVGLQGASGAEWARQPMTIYDLDESGVRSTIVVPEAASSA